MDGLFRQIRVVGCVQGVGFRPFVWQLAQRLNAEGWVLNDSEGVLIYIHIQPAQLPEFIDALTQEAPALAKVERVEVTEDLPPELMDRLKACSGFEIVDSQAGEMNTVVLADAATCDQCRSEIMDPNNRRYGYPFTNCTHCGPRYSIIQEMPYDRANTSMVAFEMCPACQAEYDQPADRRFHAQPNACPVCGPQIFLAEKAVSGADASDQAWSFQDLTGWSIIDQACRFLQQGQILAIKGVGGYHLVCDATNDQACQTLRARKRRPAKPFALMAADQETIGRYCEVSQMAQQWLHSVQAPIVLMPKHPHNDGGEALSEIIAPGQSKLGFMLPSNPLHILLMHKWQACSGHGVLVFTSANPSGRPQAYLASHEASLLDLADYLITHNRPIVRRLEDSVVLITPDDDFLVLRQARGFSPVTLKVPKGLETGEVRVAAGGDLKNALAVAHHDQIVLSHYLGDLANFEVQRAYEDALADVSRLYQLVPQVVYTDRHPGYFSTGFMKEFCQRHGVTRQAVQHHEAHFKACLVENNIADSDTSYLGIILDGLGYGSENHFWGGELLYGHYRGVKRVASLQAKPLLGGDKANQEPWRNLYVYLRELSDPAGLEGVLNAYGQVESIAQLQAKPLDLLEQMIHQSINVPMSSSMGRLFDAVSALCNLCFEKVTYEGQAATELEAYVSRGGIERNQAQGYECEWVAVTDPQDERAYELSASSVFKAILQDLQQGVSLDDIACRFHIGLANALVGLTLQLQRHYAFDTVVLSGGVCQNGWLVYLMEQAMPKEMTVLKHRWLPANDQSIAIGQVVSLKTEPHH